MSINWLVLPAILLEFGGIASLLSPGAGPEQLLIYLLAHGLACGVLVMVLLHFLPEPYRGQPIRSVLFLFTLQFAIPFVGIFGVALGILLALYLPHSQREVHWQEFTIPELPFKPTDMDSQTIYSRGGLRQVLRGANDPGKRLKALMASKQMADREAIGILREALKDKVDDVRLLAYSMLEEKEKALVRLAGELQQALVMAPQSQMTAIERRLAQTWWEMAYLGLAQGGLRTYYLNNARDILYSLVERRPQHNDWRLLGRVELAIGDLAAAENALYKALAAGAPDGVVMPYLAESAFLRRDFRQVRSKLEACPHSRSNPDIQELMEAWL